MTTAQKDRLAGFNASLKQRGVSVTIQPANKPMLALIEHPAERATFDPGVLERSGLFSAAVLETFPHAQTLDRDGLIGRATSASYVPRQGPRFERLRLSLLDLFERMKDEAGTVRMRYQTKVYRAERR